MYAENSFDLSNYDTVSALVTKNANALIDKLQVRASDKTTVLAEAQLEFVATEQWVTIDISAITAQGYIYLTANANDIISMRKCYLA
jgi:acyl-coenzyme A synthetase/AMP-(fatty) acid ligase